MSKSAFGLAAVGALVIAFFAVPVSGQALGFGHTWGSFGYEAAYSIEADADGNVYIAGEMSFRTGQGALGFVAKFEPSGQLQWDRTFMGSEGFYIWDLDIGPDGDLHLLGDSYPDDEVVVIRMSPDGDVRYSRILEGMSYVYRLEADPATGGTIVHTSTFAQDAIIALDATGEPRWGVRVAGDEYAYPYGIAVDAAGNSYALLSRLRSGSEYDLGIMKLDPSGGVAAQKVLPLPDGQEGAYDLVWGADGSLIALGWGATPLLAKFDDQLRAVWTEVLTTSVPVLDLWTLTPLSDGSFAASGGAWDYPTFGDFATPVVTFGPTGTPLDAFGFLSPQYSGDRYVYGAATSPADEVLLAGETYGVPDTTPLALPVSGADPVPPNTWIDDAVVWEPFTPSTRPVTLILSDPILATDDFRETQDYQAWWGAFDPRPGELGVDALAAAVDGLVVSFDATVSGGTGSYSFAWSFGDGGTAVAPAPGHTYPETGRYPVQLIVRDSAGRTGWDAFLVELTLPPEITFFEASPNPSSTGRPVQLYVEAVDPDGGDTFRFDWDFGDGGAASTTDPFVEHAYLEVGTFAATVVITDDEGETSSASILVEIVLNAPPSACFDWSPAVPQANEGVSFMSCSADDGSIVSHAWGFGDGGTASGSFVRHVYSAEGTYPVTLTVLDDSGDADTVSHDVSVVGILVDPGTLVVTPSVRLPTTIFVNGIARNDWDLAWQRATPGTYTISVSDVPGWLTPDPVEVIVVAGQRTAVFPPFFQANWLRVITNPALPGTISVNGIPRDDWGLWLPVGPGEYRVSFGAVAGYLPPPGSTVTFSYGTGTQTIVGTYTASPGAPGPDPASFGRLRVTTVVDDGTVGVPSTISVDGIVSNIWALDFLKVPGGQHVVEFTGVPGLRTPDPITVNVVAGDTTFVEGVFGRKGQLRIMASPGDQMFVDGIRMNDAGTWIQLRPGTYTVSWGPIAGFVTPPPQTVEVVAGGRTDVFGEYVRASAAAERNSGDAALARAATDGPTAVGSMPTTFARRLIAMPGHYSGRASTPG